jgi:hypothetical protein
LRPAARLKPSIFTDLMLSPAAYGFLCRLGKESGPAQVVGLRVIVYLRQQ